ncbi:MAG: adenylyltransferase/cytidyltransferase family protein [Anaerolineae bacterium]|nr:adenylyltransferase/cytidyltransferase family protein [Anaerolineae bacterium]
MNDNQTVIVSGSFDDLKFPQMRFLEEASRLGRLHVALWSDAMIQAASGGPPKFSLSEREYWMRSIRYVDRYTVIPGLFDPDTVPLIEDIQPDIWVVDAETDNAKTRAFCVAHGLAYYLLTAARLKKPPDTVPASVDSRHARKRVLVTGSFDWLHSGHLRFFEETAELGDLYVVVGHDDNIRLLKGDGHPLFSQDIRRYMVGSIRCVKQALISTGHGWLDAEPEIGVIHPDIYAVNEDGDQPEKREYCEQHGIEYVVLKRTPKEGLEPRSSTELRGF